MQSSIWILLRHLFLWSHSHNAWYYSPQAEYLQQSCWIHVYSVGYTKDRAVSFLKGKVLESTGFFSALNQLSTVFSNPFIYIQTLLKNLTWENVMSH